MANRLNWTPGRQGKGNWYQNGDISTWNVDEEMSPHHHEIATKEMNNPDVKAHAPGFFFYINPDGGIHDGGIGFNNQTPYDDDQVLQQIIDNDPRYYNGIFDEDNYNVHDPRVELPTGGYGHAQNLLDILSKIAKENNWADFHTELKLPRGVRQRIRRWVDKLKWPEGSEKADARTYHITILSMDEYDDKFAKWARKEMRGRHFTFKTTGMDIFADEHVVLRMDCPEWTDLVRKWTALADDQGLKPRKFEPPKAHVTIGKSPNGKWPQGVPDPHIKFDARQFNINKNSADYWGWPEPEIEPEGVPAVQSEYFHHAPTVDRERIRQHGLQISLPNQSGHWHPSEVGDQPAGVYLTTEEDPTKVLPHAENVDTWRVGPEQIRSMSYDPGKEDAYIVHHDIPDPELWTPIEERVHQANVTWATGDGVCNNCGEIQIGKDVEDGVTTCSNCGAEIPVDGEPKRSAERTIADELYSWLQHRKPTRPLPTAQPPSLHHTDADQFMPEVVAPASIGPHVDPPSKPYEPYNWANDGWEESPLDRTAGMTLPQQQREWAAIKDHEGQFDQQSEPVHQYPDGWTVRRLAHPAAVSSVGHMLHNCWQDENQMNSMKQPHSMHDADGIPRVAFYVNPNGLISQPLGHHNFYINEAIYNRLKDFADQSGHILAGPQSYEFHPDHPEYYGDFMHEGSTRTCARCHAEIDGPICSECGYDPTHADSDYEKSKANWYERAWDDAGKNQPRQDPNQPMHWRDDHAK